MVITQLSLLEFKEQVEQDNVKSDNNGYAINEKVLIDTTFVNWKFREIRNVEFAELVQVSEVEISSGLAFINCKFHKGIVIKNLDSRKFDTSINPYGSNILFSNCTSLYITFTGLCKLDRGILIEKKCKIGLVKFYETVIKNSGFQIKDSHVERNLDISRVKSEIKVYGSTIGGVLRVENLEGDVSLLKSIFKGWVKLWACTCKNSIVLNYNTFEDTFNIQGCEINTFSTIGDKFQKVVTIENRDTSGNGLKAFLNSFYISEAEITETFMLDGLGMPIHQIRLPITPKFSGVLRIVNWKIEELNVSGVNENLKLLISQCGIQRLIAIDFTNNASVSFDRCYGVREIFEDSIEKDSTFITAHSDFGSARFNEFDFDSFEIIRADNVSFNAILASNVKWFKDENLIIGDGENIDENSYRRRREIYRQIKQSLRKIGNNIDALSFQAREMIAYRNEKKISKKYGLGDRLIMLTNMSNSYGLSWLKPLILMVIITLCYYFLIIPLLSSQLSYSPSLQEDNLKLTWSEIWDKKEVFFQLFNPARRFIAVYGETGSDWLFLWDALHRLVLGILIYQIIRAFRKYYTK